MNQHAQPQPVDRQIEAALADALARGDTALGKIGPVLGHLLGNEDHALFSDEVIARVRGMTGHLARQLLLAQAQAAGEAEPHAFLARHSSTLEEALVQSPALLGYCHALALEWQLCLRLESEHALDPVLSPLVQALVASDEEGTAALGMGGLAAQARFAQAQRRMELPLGELPADLFHSALEIWREYANSARATGLDEAEAGLRESFDEGTSRLGLFERLVVAMGKGVTAALSVEHAGVGLFLSALAAASGQPRDRVTAATSERQAARLLLTLRATGLKAQSVHAQLSYLHPAHGLAAGLAEISPERAAEMLDDAWPSAGGGR